MTALHAAGAPSLTLRAMTAADATIVARLHAASWRTAYRGILSEEYLAGDVELAESGPPPGTSVVRAPASTLREGAKIKVAGR